MQLLSFKRQGKTSFGARLGDGVFDLGARLSSRFRDLGEVVAANALSELRQLVDAGKADFSLADITYLPPIPAPEKIVCIGVNYANRNEEYKDNSALPKYPSIFMRTPGSLVGHNEPLRRPRESQELDYEGEIAIVIGRGGRRIPKERALEHIGALTVLNEGSVRDWLRHSKFNVTQGKNFDRSGSIGPWMVTTDELDPARELRITTTVNGEVRQNDTTQSMIFPFDYLISYVSSYSELKPGDIISTGTPTGAGARFDPPRWLKPGDVVEVTVPGIGTLKNGVVDD